MKDTPTSLEEVNATVATHDGHGFFRRLLSFMGPAYLVAVGYMDPGNWATDIAGGSRFGYSLLWVLVLSNLIALLLQSLSARLGLVRRIDLAQASRLTYPRSVNVALYTLAELAIAAMDLAEVLGMAIGLQLLFGLPLMWGVGITLIDTVILMLVMRGNVRRLEAIVLGLISVIGLAFLAQLVMSKPDAGALATGLIPTLQGEGALYIAIGIIGATVMPHNLYLHSALVQTRQFPRTWQGIKDALKYNLIDSSVALNLALFVNAAILIVAASAFHSRGMHTITEIQDAHALLAPLLGNSLAPTLFAIALIAAGQSSTVTGTLAGQVVMEGYLGLRLRPWLRRLLTRSIAIIPAVIVIMVAGEGAVGELLVFSQVILSLQLGFAIIPLIHAVSDGEQMGTWAIGRWTRIAAWGSAALIVGLNVNLVVEEVGGWIAGADHPMIYWSTVVPACCAFAVLLVYTLVAPLRRTRRATAVAVPHADLDIDLDLGPGRPYSRIAVPVDFSTADRHALHHAHALLQPGGTIVLIHAVESTGAHVFGTRADDHETSSDSQRLAEYVARLAVAGVVAEPVLVHGSPRTTLAPAIVEASVDLVVMAGHGHNRIGDVLHGTTIDRVRHGIRVPMLVIPASSQTGMTATD